MHRPKRKTLSPVNLMRRGVPKELHRKTMKNFKDYGNSDLVKVRDYIQDYLDNLQENFINNKGLFLFGNNGVGKTYCASMIIKEAYINRYTSNRVTFVDYISEYTRVWDAKTSDEREQAEAIFYGEYKAVEFLALEELGKELDTKIVITVLEDCLRYREENGLPTIICTNLRPSEVAEKYGSSVESLIKGNLTPIKIVGSDKREEFYKRRC